MLNDPCKITKATHPKMIEAIRLIEEQPMIDNEPNFHDPLPDDLRVLYVPDDHAGYLAAAEKALSQLSDDEMTTFCRGMADDKADLLDKFPALESACYLLNVDFFENWWPTY